MVENVGPVVLEEPPTDSDDLITLARRSSGSGRYDVAVEMARDAAAIYRELARLNPAFRTDLLRALTDVAILLSMTGWQFAVAPAQEAVSVYRELVKADLGTAPDVTRSLSDLVTFLAEMSTCQRSAA